MLYAMVLASCRRLEATNCSTDFVGVNGGESCVYWNDLDDGGWHAFHGERQEYCRLVEARHLNDVIAHVDGIADQLLGMLNALARRLDERLDHASSPEQAKDQAVNIPDEMVLELQELFTRVTKTVDDCTVATDAELEKTNECFEKLKMIVDRQLIESAGRISAFEKAANEKILERDEQMHHHHRSIEELEKRVNFLVQQCETAKRNSLKHGNFKHFLLQFAEQSLPETRPLGELPKAGTRALSCDALRAAGDAELMASAARRCKERRERGGLQAVCSLPDIRAAQGTGSGPGDVKAMRAKKTLR